MISPRNFKELISSFLSFGSIRGFLTASMVLYACNDAAFAGKMWGTYLGGNEPPIIGGSACGVAIAQAYTIYGSNICMIECEVGATSAQARGMVQCEFSGARHGFADAFCSDGESMIDQQCWKVNDPNNTPKERNYCPVGNPIDPVLGLKTEYKRDLTVGLSGELVFERFYRSKWDSVLPTTGQNRLGYGWRSNFDATAFIVSGIRFYAIMPSGETVQFIKDINGTWVAAYMTSSGLAPDPGFRLQRLISVGQNYELTTEDNKTWTFNSSGYLTQIRYVSGYTQYLEYDAKNRNVKVTDSYARTLNFTYSYTGLALSVTSSTGISISFSYQDRTDPAFAQKYFPNGVFYNLSTPALLEPVLSDVTYAGVSPTSITYHYEDVTNRFGLTGITDERGVRSATFAYDAKGYAIQTKHAGNVDTFVLAYDAAAGKTTVTNPLGKKSYYTYNTTVQKRRQLTSLEGAASINCPASATSFTFDTDGNIASQVDEEGRRTTYVRDDRGRPTSITRGAP